MQPSILQSYRVTPEVIEYVWRKIRDAINPVKIILFGSQADGTPGRAIWIFL